MVKKESRSKSRAAFYVPRFFDIRNFQVLFIMIQIDWIVMKISPSQNAMIPKSSSTKPI